MGNRVLAAGVVVLMLVFAGCTPRAADVEASDAASPSPTRVALSADEIESIEDAWSWSESLDEDVAPEELTEGIDRISDVVTELRDDSEIWTLTANELQRDLISANLNVFQSDQPVSVHIAEIRSILADVDVAIEKGFTP